MSLNTLIDLVLGPQKDYNILDKDIYGALEHHSKSGAQKYYGKTGEITSTDWEDTLKELNKGPGQLQIGDETINFEQGLGDFPLKANMCRGLTREINGNNYTVFYLEPLRTASVVEETSSEKLLSSPYIIGETVEFENLEKGDTRYTCAEMRMPEEDVFKEFKGSEEYRAV